VNPAAEAPGTTTPSALTRSGPPARPGFGHNRPVPALLMRRPAATPATDATAPAPAPAETEAQACAPVEAVANAAPATAPAADHTETAQA
jgi:hypothetical protein